MDVPDKGQGHGVVVVEFQGLAGILLRLLVSRSRVDETLADAESHQEGEPGIGLRRWPQFDMLAQRLLRHRQVGAGEAEHGVYRAEQALVGRRASLLQPVLASEMMPDLRRGLVHQKM